jgi:hypothetical protein
LQLQLSIKILMWVIHIKVVATHALLTLQLTIETVANASTGLSHVVNNHRLDCYQETKLQLPIIYHFHKCFQK